MFSDQLKRLRKQRGMSQSDLAKVLFVSQQAVARWETDKATPNPETISKLVGIFAISADEILETNDAKKAPSIEDANLSPDERALLEQFRQASPALQDAALRVLESDLKKEKS